MAVSEIASRNAAGEPLPVAMNDQGQLIVETAVAAATMVELFTKLDQVLVKLDELKTAIEDS